MTTTSRSAHLRGWVSRIGAGLLAVAFCSSALADPSKNVVTTKKATQRAAKKSVKCYTWATGFGMPMPCEQMQGPIPTTSHAMTTIGRGDSTN